MKRTLIIGLALSATASFAQDPLVGPQLRMSVDNLSNSGDETSASASLNGQEIIGGFNDYRTDGTIKSSFGVTSNGGQTWAQLLVRPPAQNQTTVEGDPMACYDKRTDTIFAGAMAFGGNGGIYIAKKNPGQNSFGTSVMARVSGSVDKGWMDVGPLPGNPNTSRLYVTYNQGVIRSDDLGATWTSPLSLGSGLGFLPRVGPAGQLYVTYWNTASGIMFRRSLDGGLTFSAPMQAATRLASWGVQNFGIPGNFRNPPIHTMAVNPVNGNIVIVWFDQTNIVNGQRNLDLYMIKSVDQGSTWSAATRMPFRPLNQVSDMIFPWVEYTSEGRLHLLTFDTSFNLNQTDGSANGFWDQVYYYSDNDGTNWSQLFRLTPVSFNSFNDGRNAGVSFMGDYQGMAIANRTVFPVYLDTTTNQAEIYTNKIVNAVVNPTSFSFFRGIQTGGNLASLFTKDANKLSGKPGLVLNPTEAPIQLDVSTSGVVNTNPSQLRLFTWSNVSSPNIQRQVFAFNINTNVFDLLDTGNASTSDQNLDINVPNPSSYITPGSGTIKMRLAYKATGPVNKSAWTASHDQAVFVVVP